MSEDTMSDNTMDENTPPVSITMDNLRMLTNIVNEMCQHMRAEVMDFRFEEEELIERQTLLTLMGGSIQMTTNYIDAYVTMAQRQRDIRTLSTEFSLRSVMLSPTDTAEEYYGDPDT